MTERLIFLLGASPDAGLRWGRFSGGRLVGAGRLADAHALEAFAGDEFNLEQTVALLPGEQVAARVMAAAPRNAVRARAAARLLMEDELAESVDGLHVVADGDRACAVRAGLIEDWTAAFERAGVKLDILSTDYLALDGETGAATAVYDDGRVVAAIGRSGLALEQALFEALADRLFDGVKILRVLGRPVASNWGDGLRVENLGAGGDEPFLALCDAAFDEGGPLNLLQGRFAPRRALAPLLAPWRRAGALAAAAATLFFAGLVVEGARAEADAQRWRDEMRAVHADRYGASGATDPADHARRLLAERSEQESFLWLSSRFADALRAHEAIEIDRIRYNADRQEYLAAIRSAGSEEVEAFKATLDGLGVAAVDRGGYRRTGAYWTGELSARAK